MRRWVRAAGIAISVLAFVVLIVIGLTGEEPDPATQPDVRNGRSFIQDNLWTANGRQYAVWVGHDGTVYAGSHRVGSDAWKTENLSRLEGDPLASPTAEDNHAVYAIGVDAEHDLHIAGNMHNDPLRYVRDSAGNLQGWTTAPSPAGGESVTYPAFVALPEGTLLFFRREGIAGFGALVLDALPPGARSWHSRGVVLDGRPTGESPYIHRVAVDPRTGVIHLLFEWRSADAQTNSDVSYASSADGGRTWETSAGTQLPKPITHMSSETVIDTIPAGSGLLNSGGLAVDRAGRPHGIVTFTRGGAEYFEHVWFDHGAWQHETLDDLDLAGRPQVAGTSDGRVWLLGVRDSNVVAVDITPGRQHLPTREIAEVPVGWEVNYDSQALARRDVVQMLIPRGDDPRVVEADLSKLMPTAGDQ
jgi:hypothetical protein